MKFVTRGLQAKVLQLIVSKTFEVLKTSKVFYTHQSVNHKADVEAGQEFIPSGYEFHDICYRTKKGIGCRIDSSLETEWRSRGVRQARYPKFDAYSNSRRPK